MKDARGRCTDLVQLKGKGLNKQIKKFPFYVAEHELQKWGEKPNGWLLDDPAYKYEDKTLTKVDTKAKASK